MPTCVREAFTFLLAQDIREPDESLKTKSLGFLAAFRQLAAEPGRELTKGVLRYCLEARSHEQKGEQLPTKGGIARLTAFPDEIWKGLDGIGNPQRYRSPHGPVADDGYGSRAFHRDFMAHVDSLAARIRSESVFADEMKVASSELAGSVMVMKRKPFLEKALDDSVAADETIAALKAAGDLGVETLKMFTTEIARPKQLSLKTAWGALLRRLQHAQCFVTPDTLEQVSAWATNGTPFEFSDLPPTQQQEMFKTLEAIMRHLKSSGLEQTHEIQTYALLARQWEGCVSLAKEEPDHEFARAAASARLNARELKHIMDAADLLRAEGLHGLTLELDRAPFVWPRIAEALLLAEPRRLVVHGASAATNTDATTDNSPQVPYFVYRGAHHLPISCAQSAQTLISDEVYTSYRVRPVWEDRSHGVIEQPTHTATVSIRPSLAVSSQIRSLLKLPTLPAGAFLISSGQSTEEKPEVLAFGVLFHTVLRDVPGFKRHDFGKTLHLYVATERKPLAEQPAPQPTVPEVVTVPTISPVDVVVPSSTPSPVQPTKVAKVKKAPIPKEPRPAISHDQALSAKVVLTSLPEIQTKATQSHALNPTIPFKDASIITTLNILKNGERPGTKSLKELRTYVEDDKNFRDCLHHADLVRTTLKKLISDLLG